MQMTTIKVLGTGCPSCKATVTLIEDVARAKGVDVTVEKVEDMQAIVGYGVMRTPAVVIAEQVVHAGGVPTRAAVEGWVIA
jgi:small redox-active disulfide protein 2